MASSMSSRVKHKKKRRLQSQHGRKCANPNCNQRVNLTLDHKQPKSQGGSNRISNMQLLCRACNKAKGSQFIDYVKLSRELQYRMPDYDLIQKAA